MRKPTIWIGTLLVWLLGFTVILSALSSASNPQGGEAETIVPRRGDKAMGGAAGTPVNDLCQNSIPILDGRTEFDTRGAHTDGPQEFNCNFLFEDLQVNQDIWFDYTASCTGELTVSLCETADPPAGFDTKVALYPTSTCPPAGAALACNDDSCGPPVRLASEIRVRVVGGQIYKLRIGGFGVEEGRGAVNITCAADFPPCVGGSGDCCAAHANPGCADAACCQMVCENDSGCCSGNWTESCAAAAAAACPVCGGGTGAECQGCITLPSNQTLMGTTVGATGTMVTSCGAGNDRLDVWYCWTADCTGQATVSLCGSSFDTTVAVFDRCGGTEIACNDDGCQSPTVASRVTFPATSGESYRIRVAGWGGASGSYQIRVTCAAGQPNDLCANALPITVGDTNYRTVEATTDGPILSDACREDGLAPLLGQDIWYNFVAPCSGIARFSTCGTADYDSRMAVYEGCACPVNNTRLIGCNDDLGPCAGFTSEMSIEVTQGVCYKLRVGGFATFGSSESGNGTIRVECQTQSPADRCQSAPIYPLPHTFTGDNTYSSNDCLDFRGDQDWIAFQIPQTSDVMLDYCETSPRFDNAWLHLARGCPCASRTAPASACFICPDGNAALRWFCLPAGTYYYPVLSEPGSRGPYTIHVSAARCTQNNACAGAVAITDGDTLFSTVGATTDGPALPAQCDEGTGISFNKDIWFDYSATCTGRATFSTCGTADYNTRLAVYEGTACPVDPATLLGCNDDDENCDLSTSRLTVDVVGGHNYKLRVGGLSTLEGRGCIHVGCEPTVPSCPDGRGIVTFINPPDNVVDARQPRNVDGGPLLGIDSFRLRAPEGADPACFEICETNTGGLPPNAITGVQYDGDGIYMVQLARPITPGAVTTLTYMGGVGVTGTFTYHPGNANGDTTVSVFDILAIIDYLNRVATPPWGPFSTDIDRSGVFLSFDILRLIDVFNGAGELDPWNGTPRPTNGGVCP